MNLLEKITHVAKRSGKRSGVPIRVTARWLHSARVAVQRLRAAGITQKRIAELVAEKTTERISTAELSRILHGHNKGTSLASAISEVLGIAPPEGVIDEFQEKWIALLLRARAAAHHDVARFIARVEADVAELERLALERARIEREERRLLGEED